MREVGRGNLGVEVSDYADVLMILSADCEPGVKLCDWINAMPVIGVRATTRVTTGRNSVVWTLRALVVDPVVGWKVETI